MTAPGLYLSIDFEDFAHDLKRDLGLWDSGPLRTAALWRAYEVIEDFLKAHGGARVTFFCTGIIAEQLPDLIARIAADGHEIGCHYHFHDCIDRETPAAFGQNLARALRLLRAASGQPVAGFRAPKFRIDRMDTAQYGVLAAQVGYDSSYLCDHAGAVRDFAVRIGAPLDLLPVWSGRLRPGLPVTRLGGTYLKLYPEATARAMAARAQAGGMVPHVYLHPYEFLADGAFALSRAELAPLGPARAAFWWARQAQWHRIGNARLPGRLSRLIGALGLGGRLCDARGRLAV